MREHLRQMVRSAGDPAAGWALAREYLQIEILASLQRAGAMVPLAFHGGTALRLLFSLPRYSEDLDFALERLDRGYSLRAYVTAITRDLTRAGYHVDAKINDAKTVHGAFIRFPGLPFDLGLSPQKTQVLAVKLEVDTRPPSGAVLETSIIRRHALLHLQHHDRSSLLAGKLHAVLTRVYLKGRDFYDLLWYLADSRWPGPNLVQLRSALVQSRYFEREECELDWRVEVRRRAKALDWDRIRADVRPFLERAGDEGMLTEENLLRLLGRAAG